MKNLSILEKKLRYRLLKVIYFTVLLLLLVAVIIWLNESYDRKFSNDLSYIQCSNWTIYNLSTNSVYLYSDYISSYDEEKFTNWCNQNGKNDNTFKLVSRYTEKDWTSIFKYSILCLIVMFLVTEILKRILYYIVLGAILPSNSPEIYSESKQCPYCWNNILKSARKCKFCKEWVS